MAVLYQITEYGDEARVPPPLALIAGEAVNTFSRIH